MDYTLDPKKTIEVIERLKVAQIGERQTWQKIIEKLKNKKNLSASELGYFTNFTRTYRNLGTGFRSKNYHTKLSVYDIKPKCKLCENESNFYCTMNDEYFCIIHVVGHDENEF